MFTILREPIDRIVSHYYFAKQDEQHYLHRTIIDKQLSLFDYVTSGLSGELTNHYTKNFCGYKSGASVGLSTNSVDKAIARIKQDYAFVGFQHLMDNSMKHLQLLA